MAILCKSIYTFTVICVEILVAFFTEVEQIIKQTNKQTYGTTKEWTNNLKKDQ